MPCHLLTCPAAIASWGLPDMLNRSLAVPQDQPLPGNQALPLAPHQARIVINDTSRSAEMTT